MTGSAAAHAVGDVERLVGSVLPFLYVVGIDGDACTSSRLARVMGRVFAAIAGAFLDLLRPCSVSCCA
jgi:hypothetical protein